MNYMPTVVVVVAVVAAAAATVVVVVKHRLLYLKIQFVPYSKHSSSQL